MSSHVSVRDKLDFLVRATGRSEAQIVAEALEVGLAELSRKEAMDSFLSGALSRADVVRLVGEGTVREWESARQAIERDVRWGLGRD